MKQIFWVVFGILAVGALLLLFARGPSIEPTPIVKENITETTSQPSGATYGDLISINFILYLENGTVVDTNNPKLAEEYKLKNYVKGPYAYILGQSGKVKGFDEALLATKEGQHKEVIIEPSEPELILKIDKVKGMKRFNYIQKLQAFPRASFEKYFNKPPIIGDVVISDKFVFKYQIVNISDKHVIGKMIVKEGEKYWLPNTEWESAVIKEAKEDVLFYYMPEENQTIETPFGPARITLMHSAMYINFEPELNKIFNRSFKLTGGYALPQQFQIVEIGEEEFTIMRYGALADKRLKLVADIISIIEDVKKVKQKAPLVTEVDSTIEN